MPHHVLCHCGLTDLDAHFEQFPMDMGRTPQRIFAAHLRIRSRTSQATAGRPTRPCRIFQVQKRRNPWRRQAITVAGLDDV